MTEQSMNRPVWRVLMGGISVVILGALGSGLWQYGFAPLFDVILNVLVRFLGTLFFGYKDMLYQSASEGFHEEHSLSVYIFMLGLMTAFYFAFLLVLHRRRVWRDERPPAPFGARVFFPESKVGIALLSVFYGAAIVSFILFTIQAAYSNRITTYATTSVEILSPYVGDQQTRVLRSEFLRARTAKLFYDFHQELQTLAATNKVELPKFKPL